MLFESCVVVVVTGSIPESVGGGVVVAAAQLAEYGNGRGVTVKMFDPGPLTVNAGA